MSKSIDITGRRFGRLLVIGQSSEKTSRGNAKWNCVCDCGKQIITSKNNLLRGDTKSCGCLKRDLIAQRSTKHGECASANSRHSRLYRIYSNMLSRCLNANIPSYKRYGGRGIEICEEWLNDPISFFQWAYDHGYTDGLTIDRIDNNKGYCPENCRFASRKAQENNTSRNHYITYLDKTQSMSAWADEYRIPYHTFRSRINNLGWDVHKALTTPVRHMKSKNS